VQIQLLSTGEIVIAHDPHNGVASHQALVGVTQGGGATANPVVFSSIVGAPINTGTNPTAYQEYNQRELRHRRQELRVHPNGQGGYLIFENAPPAASPHSRANAPAARRRRRWPSTRRSPRHFRPEQHLILCVRTAGRVCRAPGVEHVLQRLQQQHRRR